MASEKRKEQKRKASLRYYYKHKDKVLAQRKSNKRGIKASEVKFKYGLTLEHVEAVSKEQNGLCAICREKEATDIDHDHFTGVFRGLLCGNCNTGIGLLKERKDILENAITYLKPR